MNMTVAVVGFALASGAIGVGAARQPRPEEVTSICELARRGPEMSGRPIRLSAIYETDHRHGSVLLDRKCSDVAMRLRYSLKEPRDRSLDDFERAQQPSSTTRPPYYEQASTFTLEVSGEFVWHPAEKLPGELVVDRIWRFKEVPGTRLPGLR